MSNSILDVIVIGAGHAGLSASYFLSQQNKNHIVFERGKIGESWRSQRWDSFRLNSSNRYNLLPGQKEYFNDPDAFPSAFEFASALESYSKINSLPVKENCKVVEVDKGSGSDFFTVSVNKNDFVKQYRSKQIVIASGGQNEKVVPSFSNNISEKIFQIHTSEYRNAKQLPDGNVFVVGSAQSGVQIAEDLALAGKKVFLSTAKVGRIPRSYKGKDIFDWLFLTGFFDVKTEDITDPAVFKMKPPQVSGVGERGRTTSLQSLARHGVVILGKAINADNNHVFLEENAVTHVKYADEVSIKTKRSIDGYIEKNQIAAPQPETDINDEPDENASCASALTTLNLSVNNITCIIWSTGFIADFSYLKCPAFNKDKSLKHRNGLSEIPGLYFLGLPWMRKRKSAVIFGITEDAEFIANQLV